MNENSKIFSLEKLAQMKYPILFDTCTILHCLDDEINSSKKKDFFILMKNYIKKSNFYISYKVIEELQEGNDCTEMIKVFIDNDRIFELNEREQNTYRDLYRKFAYFMDDKIMGDKVLSETDFDLQIKGFSRAKKSGPIALASNDLKIYHASKVILKKEDICYRFEFFIRKNFLIFKRICDNFEDVLRYI